MSPGGAGRNRAALLDVNVLIALGWPNHTHHRPARRWFDEHHPNGWATTPITESGFVRVSSNRAAVKTATTPAVALKLLERMTSLPGHAFWPDEVALVIGASTDPALMRAHRDVTDAHLLALAERRGGRLVTFDSHIKRLLGDRNARLLQILEG